MNITLTGDVALAMKYAVELARSKAPEFKGMTDSEVLSRLVETGLGLGKEAPV